MFSRTYIAVRQSSCSLFSRFIPPVIQTPAVNCRPFSVSSCLQDVESADETEKKQNVRKKEEGKSGYVVKTVDPLTSIEYMNSEAYQETYGDKPVWVPYRRNQAGTGWRRLRRTCIRAGVISTGSACPICRDDYLVFDYRNVKLLKQFISEVDSLPRNPGMTGLCQKQYRSLIYAVRKAQDHGYIEKHVPMRLYDYEYYKELANNE